MAETRKIAAILAADVVGFSRMTSADEDGTLARLRALRRDLIDPTVAAHNGRVFKRTGDGALIEFRSVVDAVRCAIEVQNTMVERNAGVPEDRRIIFRIGIHLGDVVEESDGDLMGDGVNIAARLEGICEPAGACLSEDAYLQVRDKLKHEFVDLGEKALKNIARPLRVYAIKAGSRGPAHAQPVLTPGKQGPPFFSIVVLPFANIGGDPEQDYFVDGVTDSLTTDLSRINGSFVIARNTAFTFKGKAVDVKQIGRELNVRYVLEGSVQRRGQRMRVNVQLIDTEDGHHLWAERFDKPLADLFEMQDEIVARLANALNTQLVAAEARRAERAPNPNSRELCLQGWALYYKGMTPDNIAQARSFFERALSVDPNNIEALVGSAAADMAAGFFLLVADPPAVLAAAEAKVTRGLSSFPDHAASHLMLGCVYMLTKRATEGVAECERALALNRNLATAHAIIGGGKIFLVHPEETEAHIVEALRLSPRDTMAYVWMHDAGCAKGFLGLYDEAVAWFRRAIEANRNHPHAHFMLGNALAWIGRQDEARSAVRAGLALYPSFTISRARAVWTASTDNPAYLAMLERVYEGLRKAGVPE